MIISIDAEKSFNKIQLPYMKTSLLGKLETKRHFINLIKSMYKKAKANKILNGETMEAFPLKSFRGFSLKEQDKETYSCHFHSAIYKNP